MVRVVEEKDQDEDGMRLISKLVHDRRKSSKDILERVYCIALHLLYEKGGSTRVARLIACVSITPPPSNHVCIIARYIPFLREAVVRLIQF